jgi:hypothetical protein
VDLHFLVGAIVGSGIALTLCREPAHRLLAVVRARRNGRRD